MLKVNSNHRTVASFPGPTHLSVVRTRGEPGNKATRTVCPVKHSLWSYSHVSKWNGHQFEHNEWLMEHKIRKNGELWTGEMGYNGPKHYKVDTLPILYWV